MANIGKVQPAPIIEEMQRSYLDYAMSVIVSRALPDVRDGLKPVQRRIIFAMHEQGLHHTSRYQKSAAVVGEVLKNLHPHGDAPVYEAMVRMAQNFSLRYMLVDGQGNYGSIDGDSPAAMRYCLIGNTIVPTSEGLLKIEDISNKEDISINILSRDRKINSASKWFDSGEHPTIKVTTNQGFTIQGSYNHPLLTWVKNPLTGKPEYKWKLLSQIKEGDITVIDRTSDILWPAQTVTLEPFIPVDPSYRTQIKTLPKTLTSDLAYILGGLISESYIGKDKIEFCNSDEDWINEFEVTWKKVFPDCRLHKFLKKPSSYGKKPYYRLEIHSLYIIEFLKNLGLNPVKAAQKNIPQVILQSPKEIVARFLQSYFEGDGSISSSKKMIELSAISISEKLISQLQTVFLRFGIASTKRFDSYKSAHKLYIRGLKNYRLFQQEIGFLSKRKNEKLQQILSLIYKDSSLLDYVPFLRDYVLSQLDANLSYNKREFAIKHNFDRYFNLAQNYSQIVPTIIPTLKLETQQLFEHLIFNNYLFDFVTKVENGGIQKVYSLKVDSGCHSFVGNGFINHNTEARLSAIADELLRDINKNTVEFIDNYSGTTKEPVLLPSVIPNLLLNGASGIAVGMATQIPPHNLGEVCNALIYMIEHPEKGNSERLRKSEDQNIGKSDTLTLRHSDTPSNSESFRSDATVEDLITFIKGPDFPTGASIYDQTEILAAYATGKGRIVMRAKADIDENAQGKMQIIVSELPFQVNKSTLIARIADLVKDKKLDGIADLRDESDRKQMVRIVFDLKRDAKPQSLLNNLYKHTAMQSVFNVNLVALSDGVPHLLTLKRILEEFITHRQVVTKRRSEFELAQAKAREHILEGLKIAVDNIDEVIETIKKSKDADEARGNLMKKFKLTQIQAVAILDMQLRRLAALEIQKIEDELKMIRETIAYLEDLLAHPEKILKVIKEELSKIKEKYADGRRTRVYKQKVGEFNEEDLVANEVTIATITEGGYIKRQSPSTFRTQQRGGKGVMGISTKETDAVSHIFYTQTHDSILFFTSRGRVFQIKVWEIPETQRAAKGQAIVNLINVEQGEKVTAVLTTRQKGESAKYFFMCTKIGTVKKTSLAEYANIRKSGLVAIKLDPQDELGWVCPTSGKDDLIIVSKTGKSIRFSETQVKPTHRDTSGVRGIRLGKQDEVVSLNIVNNDDAALLVIMENGLGKKTKFAAWKRQGRGGQGVKAAQVTQKTGNIVTAQAINENMDTLVLTSTKGQLIKMDLKEVPTLQRQTQGVILMRVRSGEKVVAATVVSSQDKTEDNKK